MNIDVNEAIAGLEELRKKHDDYGKRLLTVASGKLFPCDAVYFSILNRSLELFDGFVLLMKNNNYGCGMALLRIQLDSVLRFYGVLHTVDPLETAHAMLNGTKLSSLKDRKGKKLKDVYLVELMGKDNSWVSNVYDLTSGYIHLSNEHVLHMLGRSHSVGDGQRKLYVGSDDEHVDAQRKIELIKAFGAITEGVFMLLAEWEKLSKSYCSADLEDKYAVLA